MRIRLSALALLAFAVAAAPAPAPAATAKAGVLECVTVIEGGDIGEKFCFNEPGCYVAYYRTTFIGTTRVCLVPDPV